MEKSKPKPKYKPREGFRPNGGKPQKPEINPGHGLIEGGFGSCKPQPPSIEVEDPQMTCGGGGGAWFLWFVAGMLLALALTSCRSVKYVPVERTVTDSIVYRDTFVTERLVPYKDSVAVRDTTSYLSNEYAYSRATFSKGTMTHVLGIWPWANIKLEVPNYRIRKITIKEPQIVEVEKKLTWMQQKKLDYFGLSVIANMVLMVIIAWIVRIKGRKR